MKTLDPLAQSDQINERMKTGAFLNVKTHGKFNTMTIGWGLVGIMWRMPMLMVAVRNTRHTFGLMENAQDFSVSLPSGDQSKALDFCGSRSGRDTDKLAACQLAVKAAQAIESPILDLPGLHLECKIRYKNPVDPAALDAGLARFYPDKDYHTLYFAEIVACYETE